MSSEARQFILENESTDERQLVLKHHSIHGVPSSFIAQQIAGRRKAKEKLPMFYRQENILYPPAINLEQTSSETTANYKNEIIRNEVKGNTHAVDLTTGFGVDAYFLSLIFSKVDCVEPNTPLLEIVKHNYRQLHVHNVSFHNLSAEVFLDQLAQTVDLIFIDPSRRSRGDRKVFKLQDCEPDVVSLQHLIFKKTETLLIKASPLLDIQQGLKEVACVEKVFVVSVDNDCKEVLFLAKKDYSEEPLVRAVNIHSNGIVHSFAFHFSKEQNAQVEFSRPLNFLYEPNASLLKAGAFKLTASQHNLYKLHINTHFYTSEILRNDFPGRIFKIEALLKSDPKSVKEFFPEGKANVIARNYPLNAEQLKKKLKLKDGGEKYLIAGAAKDEKFLCSALRIA